MNFLELCQETYALLRIGQGDLGTEPETVVGQTGKLSEVVRFVRNSWLDIQNSSPYWRFMKREATLLLPQGQAMANPFAIPDYESLILAQSDADQRFITFTSEGGTAEQIARYCAWPDFQQSYLQRMPRSEGTPSIFTITPSGMLEFDSTASAPITLRIYYKTQPQRLIDDAETPTVPAKHHMVVVWWAINNYYCTTRDDANALRATSAMNLMRELRMLRHEQLEEVLGVEGGL